MPNQTIAFSVPIADGERIKALISASVKQYNLNSLTRCTKGKALKYLIELGFTEFLNRIEQKQNELKEKYGRMVELEAIDKILEERTDG